MYPNAFKPFLNNNYYYHHLIVLYIFSTLKIPQRIKLAIKMKNSCQLFSFNLSTFWLMNTVLLIWDIFHGNEFWQTKQPFLKHSMGLTLELADNGSPHLRWMILMTCKHRIIGFAWRRVNKKNTKLCYF